MDRQRVPRPGIGKEMRSTILHLAFAGLGATEAHGGAFHDNVASLGVFRSLGCVDNGVDMALRRDAPDQIVNLRLDRASWLARDDMVICGLDRCQDMCGRLIPASRHLRQ
jgi:hypothetical protein